MSGVRNLKKSNEYGKDGEDENDPVGSVTACPGHFIFGKINSHI